jgi:hypothetical protein
LSPLFAEYGCVVLEEFYYIRNCKNTGAEDTWFVRIEEELALVNHLICYFL